MADKKLVSVECWDLVLHGEKIQKKIWMLNSRHQPVSNDFTTVSAILYCLDYHNCKQLEKARLPLN